MTNYIFKPGDKNLTPVLVLHSTGGDEKQLIPLAEDLFPNHPLLSIRGRVSDQGINRYFKLKGPGFTKENFDLESLSQESQWLAAEVVRLGEEYELDLSKLAVIGYSNGANVALYMQLKGLIQFDRVLAFHAMQLTDVDTPVIADESKIFLTHADNDPIVTRANLEELSSDLQKTECELEVFKASFGHQLSNEELVAAKKWLAV
ncbi:alpha/beta hydrolase [Lactococcus formosensis]|uniref:Alpha/beta hydrolase n=1 Tax=Lactococcus formosensis TaxID=1281486 RepID=A0A9X4P4K3_9LACT|nr:alpha/beta hydrolase [Lactococcus formosensis]MCH1723653.1 alpha/beta hydrolase [Lactococcus formosensis]MCO7181064.1 alpha/beta hydrolase [Lactococcus formosensis]MDG6111409.1 alpha/beta hydrolase [Lactococcus formosensis]MDG6113668.1 alpha/beta hydrolase [Lactococcus formosensis]MDG6115478.1 alpha/beta hydrolase [Lactococcus formosensis]